MRAAGLLALAAGLIVGCGPEAEESSEPPASAEEPPTCEAPPEGAELDPAATLVGLSGDWALTVVAEEGEAAGARQEASLTLSAHELEMQTITGMDGQPMANASAPLYGSTDLDIEALGALSTSGLDSTDPAAPGVGVYETRQADDAAPPSIILRLGAGANRRDAAQAMDGGSTALRVLVTSEGSFGGTWRSQVNAQTVAAGYFCAALPTEGYGD